MPIHCRLAGGVRLWALASLASVLLHRGRAAEAVRDATTAVSALLVAFTTPKPR